MIYTFVVLGVLLVAVIGTALAGYRLASALFMGLLAMLAVYALMHGWEFPR